MKFKILLVVLCVSFLVFNILPTNAALPGLSPGGHSFLLGSNLVCDSMSDPFLNSTAQQNAAAVVLGVMRFPCRTLPTSDVARIADIIRAKQIEPLVILSAATNPQDNVGYVTALIGKATYFEFGNENNYAQGWSGAQYAAAWRNWVPQIRAANPNVKIGGPVGSHFDSNGSTYLRDFLNAIKNEPNLYPDFISMHVYAEHGEDTSDQAVIDKAHSWGDGIDRMKSDSQSILGVTLPIAITEWNWDAAPENTGDDRDNDATFMHNFAFAVLDEFKAHGVWMSCQYDFGSGAGAGYLDMINYNGSAKPQYTAFVDWSNANPPGPSPTPTPSGPPPSGQSMEAENMTLTNYAVNTNSAASGGNLVKLSSSGVTGSAVYNFTGSTGTYDIKTYYFDENDGACTFNVYVNGVKVDTWVANQNLGSADPTAQTRTSRTKTGVTIANGAQIKIEAVQNSQEWGRLDNVQIIASGSTPTPTPTPTVTPTTTRHEGENSTGYNEVKTWPSGYSGSGIGVRWSNGTMSWSKNFNGGTYSFTVRCNDYSGTQTFYVQLDGVNKGGPYTMSAGDKSWKTFIGSFGTVTSGNHTVAVNFTSDSANSDLYCDYIDITGL